MLLEELKDKIEEYDIISFDIFDTLLIRPYITPDSLWDHLGYLYNVDNFKNIRWWAFLDAREYYCNGEIDEVTLEQIYEFIPEEYKFLKEKEVELEIKVLQQNFEMKQVVDYAIANGKKVIAISDMYLPKEVLRKILDKNGYSEISQIYVSSEIKLLKGRGKLYEYVLNDLNIDAKDILHIGDNYHSDIEMAQQNGIEAIHYPKIIDKYFEYNPRALDFWNTHKNSLQTSIMLGLFALFLHNNNLLKPELEPEEYWYKIGVEYAAPLALGFSQWLNKKFQEDNIEEALFVARDGYLLQKVFEIINPHLKTHYIYAPRMIALAGTLDLGKKFEHNDFEGISGVKALQEYFNKKYEQEEEEVEFNSRREAYKYFLNKKPLWTKYSEAECEYYKNYIESLKITGNNLAVIDTSTFFFTAHQFLEKIITKKTIKGYYYWINKKYINQFSKYLNFEAYSYNGIYTALFEFLITSPELPIVGIQNNKPIYKDKITEEEELRCSIVELINTSTINFTKFAIEIFKDISKPNDPNTINDWINRFKYTPTIDDYTNFSKLFYSYSVNHENYKPIFPDWNIIAEQQVLEEKHNITPLQQIFSVKNEYNHKVVRCCGVKMKFKRNK